MWHASRRGEVFTGFGFESPKGRLGRPGRRREDNIQMDLREIGIDGTRTESNGEFL
jgi:hypothetical protein